MNKILKKLKNNTFLGFILGIIVMSGIGVSATVLYQSNLVSYTPTDTNWNVDNVKDAIDELYAAVENNKDSVIYLGTGTTFDLKKYDGYQNFTNSNFIVSPVVDTNGRFQTIHLKTWEDWWFVYQNMKPTSYSYNSTTGVLTVTRPYIYATGTNEANGSDVTGSLFYRSTKTFDCKVYLIKGEIISAS